MNNDSIEFFAKADRNRIAYVTKVFEAMSHLAIISTVDRQQGTLRIICDGQAAGQVKKILQNLDCQILS
ncbi:MAG: DUF4911 domain-containing protein [Clostridiales bacterium]